MVRSIVAILLSRGMASESGVLMQSQSNNEGSLALAETSRGSVRVEKMKMNSKAMEEQYKSLLQQVVDARSLQDPATGKPYLPNKGFLDIVEQQFALMRAELVREKELNEEKLNEDHASIARCNSARSNAFPAILSLQGTMQTDRGAHSSCRGSEDTEIADMETKCTTFDAIQDKCDIQNEGVNQDWYAQFHDNDDNPLKTIVGAATACHQGVETIKVRAKNCDDAQDDFRASYCAYANELQSVCFTHKDCYLREKKALAQETAQVKVLERDGKAIYRTIEKIKCYVDALLAAQVGSMPTQSTVNGCNGKVIDDSSLTIVYREPDEMDNCGGGSSAPHKDLGGDARDTSASASYRPGKGNWYDAEMVGLTDHEKLNDDDTC